MSRTKSRPKAKISRALGIALTPKCVRYFENRPYPPGPHGRKRRKESDYKTRQLEKQRLRHQYNVSEKQMRRAFTEALRTPGKTGESLIAHLESRLDAVILRAGFARTIYQARQFVSHRHFTVNGVRVNVPSYRVQPGDVIEVHETSRAKTPLVVAASGAHAGEPVPYLDAAVSDLRVTFLRKPTREEVPVICNVQLVVEYYSR
ncbi:MAG: 30S ribosomal protein S4 [Corynebacteriales bacterium]|nr:30S ribosomal protein S4 [Mycobacteriales bacterium]